MAEKNPNDPATTSAAYDRMAPKWDRIQTLLGGTDAMREAGQEYLPPHDQESMTNYNERLQTNTLFNMLELTLDALVGRPFSSDIQMSDDMADDVKAMLDDVDLQGNNVTVFGRAWFRESLAKGFSHVLIDMPKVEERPDGLQRTREDDLRENRRPYWVHVSPENILAMHAENVNGREHLTHVRILETVVERDGYAEVYKRRVRILEPGQYWVLEERKVSKKSKKVEWVIVDEGQTGLGVIPLVTFYANRSGLQESKPPLDDLSHLNVRHWQSTADQINVLTVARFPMLAVAGATDTTGSVMAIGPRQLLGTKDPTGRFYYVEHTGRAIAAGRQDLLDLEEMMASYGAEFLKRKPGNATATGRALDSAEATSALQDHVVRFQDSLNVAIDIMARWMGRDEAGSVTINTEFGKGQIEESETEALLEARKMGDLSREDFLNELKRHGVLSDDFNTRENYFRALMEAAIYGPEMKAQVAQDLRTEANNPPEEPNEPAETAE